KPFVTLRNNVVARGKYGIFGSGFGEGNRAIDYYLPHSVITHNVIIGVSESPYPAGNFFPATATDVAFVDVGHGDYRLARSSRYKGVGTDGRDPGADFAALEAATAGVSGAGSRREVTSTVGGR